MVQFMVKNNLQNKIVAVVRIRGRVNVRGDIAETLDRLRLKRVNNCTILRVSDSYKGMLNMCSNYVAYGEVAPETLDRLLERSDLKFKASEILDGKQDMAAIKESMPFKLHPPRHGFKSTKLNFNQGGSLGYMGPEINKLINRMV
jgi:large subunit ribosomal protein L30